MSDTPEIDAAQIFLGFNPDEGDYFVPAEIARKLEQQRDRLAEALKEIYNVSSFDYATMPELARKKYREVVLEMADEALADVEGGSHE